MVPAVDSTSNPSRILLEKPSFVVDILGVVTAPLFRKFGNRVVKIVGNIEAVVIVGGGVVVVVVSILLVVVDGIVVVVVVVVLVVGLLVVVVGSIVVDDNNCNMILLRLITN